MLIYKALENIDIPILLIPTPNCNNSHTYLNVS